jgi:hypothetical protein
VVTQAILHEIRRKKRMWRALKSGGSAEENREQEKRVKNRLDSEEEL